MTLNWRHQASLFLTVVAVGMGLFLECSAKQAVGITLLGIAFSWLIGALSPRALVATFAILLCAVGLYVAVAPVWSDRNSVQRSAAEYDVAIADLQSEVSRIDLSAGLVPKSGKVSIPPLPPGFVLDRPVTIPDSVQSWICPEQRSAGDWFTQNAPELGFPETMSDAEIMKAFQTNILLPRPTFHPGSSVRAHAWSLVGGLAFFTSGLSILGWMFRRRRDPLRISF
jgi:hypothetical protein